MLVPRPSKVQKLPLIYSLKEQSYKKKISKSICSKEISLSAGENSKLKIPVEDIKLGRFYAWRYDNDWYFCTANYVSVEDGDVNVKFYIQKVLC